MQLYTKTQTANIHEQTFAFLEITESENVLTITLDRAAKKNALHPQMINEIAYAMHYAHFEKKTTWLYQLEYRGT